ncbi:ferredoxin [Ruegeria sp. 2205SS24-7]|uniref:ferredoxin n=1 Tax=Ruegeria discodermiae TaxID=3064389 RepID=UPI002741BB59|nr:ferredoxin [Ruegeria sp. 2205SS24-7]MDP5220127.1 ferredoxin [Ruegeria sp. 2205SS24-7]
MDQPALHQIEALAAERGLIVMGAFHPRQVYGPEHGTGTLVLLGTGPEFWSVFSHATEYRDGHPHAVDRWSQRVVGGLARHLDVSCSFPFGGPPYEPFIDWALKSGRCWQSPVGMLVHDKVGLMISFRGALHLDAAIPLPAPPVSAPCATCEAPCTVACPVGALSAEAPYDLAACHGFLDTDAGTACMTQGCAARRACPVSAGAGRTDAQSALHMRAFHST